MLKEFREFLLRGNVVDLAVAVVIGAAFGALITSFTANILTPLLGLIGVPDFSQLGDHHAGRRGPRGRPLPQRPGRLHPRRRGDLLLRGEADQRAGGAAPARDRGDADHQDLHRVRQRDPAGGSPLPELYPAPAGGLIRPPCTRPRSSRLPPRRAAHRQRRHCPRRSRRRRRASPRRPSSPLAAGPPPAAAWWSRWRPHRSP